MKLNHSDNEKRLHSGAWVDEHPCADNKVTCIRCFNQYIIRDAPRTNPGTDGYYIKEPQCPSCKCRIYFSHI